ncbi:MAG: universal stress protein [Cyanobacteria bacterium SZAS LIN-5]|nr:universal stress protein [Cyanobacteria bacterium SZAS LIN-5]
MPKILLPVDVLHPHEEFIDQLDKLVNLKSSQVHLLYVKDELPGYEAILGTVGDFPEDLKHQIEQKIADEFAAVKSNLEARGAAVTSEVVGGLAGMMIEQCALDSGCDMIAISAGTHGRIEQFLMGSTAGRVVNHAPCTVLILKHVPNVPIKNVLIAIDGSDAALNAATAAVRLFSLDERDVQVTLINVVSIKPMYKFIAPVQFVAAIEDNLVMSGEASLAAAEKELSELGVTRLDNILKNGEPADEIINAAKTLKADLIVLGAQGRSAVEKFLMGSVSQRVATFAKCSTAVIK